MARRGVSSHRMSRCSSPSTPSCTGSRKHWRSSPPSRSSSNARPLRPSVPQDASSGLPVSACSARCGASSCQRARVRSLTMSYQYSPQGLNWNRCTSVRVASAASAATNTGGNAPEAEADHALGQRAWQRRARAEARDQPLEARRAVGAARMRRPDFPHERAPQRGLPFVAGERAIRGGACWPPRPAASAGGTAGTGRTARRGDGSSAYRRRSRRDGVEVAAHRVEAGLLEQPRQHAHQPYRELLLAPGGGARRLRIVQHRARQRVQEYRGRVVAQVRGHAQPRRDALAQPLGHPDVGHDQLLGH